VRGGVYVKWVLVGLGARPHHEHLVSWVNIDCEDQEPPARFVAVLIAAVENVLPGAGAAADAAFAASSDPAQAWLSIVDLLINAIAEQREKIVLVLDDVQLVDTWIYKLLAYLLERLPSNLHVVLVTRDDPPIPLGRWRAAKIVAEFCRDDLRFDSAEIHSVTAAHLGGDPSPRIIERIEARTDGWPACVVILAGALDAGNPDALLDRIDGRHRNAFEFLSSEVFRKLTERQRDFLLSVSVLDELSAEVCESVSGRADSFTLLQELYAKGAFLTAMDDEQRVFRFNELFRSLLRETLTNTKSRDDVRALHLLAGGAEPVPERAIEHFIQAQAWERAADAIETHGSLILRRGSTAQLTRWIRALPAEVLAARARLLQLLGAIAWTGGQLTTAAELLTRAADAFGAAKDNASRGESLVLLSHTLTASCDLKGAARALSEAAECGIAAKHRSRIIMQAFWRAVAERRGHSALRSLDEALDFAAATRSTEALQVISEFLHCHIIGVAGAALRIERFCRLVDEIAGEVPPPLITASLRLQAWFRMWRGELADALLLAEEADARNTAWDNLRWTTLEVSLIQTIGYAISGTAAASDRALRRLENEIRRRGSTSRPRTAWLLISELGEPEAPGLAQAWQSGYLIPGARANLLLGREAPAYEIASSIAECVAVNTDCAVSTLARPFARGMCAAILREWDAAEDGFREAIHEQGRLPLTALFGDARLRLADVLLSRGSTSAARELMLTVMADLEKDAAPGVLLWEPKEMIVPLLRLMPRDAASRPFADDVLARIDKPSQRPTPASNEFLTSRERDVLRYLNTGASNGTIASQLGISVHTVKRHVANLLQKLEANTRGEAVAAARNRGLAQ
jgi:LuxR family maltose regulon positive regulatory protein